jgi:hypothetical protein
MSISSEIRRAGPFAGNGSTVNFPFVFKVFATSQVAVTRTVSGVETTLTLTTDYTVTLNSNQDTSPGGIVTMLTAPASGQSITITSNVANLQPTVLANLGGFYPEVINDSLDRATIQIKQLDERLDRALVIPVSSSGVSTQLPTPQSSALIGWDSNATSLQNYSNIPIPAGSTTYQYVHRVLATAAQTAFTLPIAYVLNASAITVFVNGLKVEQGTTQDWVETNTTTVTFNSGLTVGDLVVFVVNILASVVPIAAFPAASVSAFGATLVDDANAAAARVTLGISTFGSSLIDDADAAAARTTLGLGTLATLNTVNNGNWSGTALAIANGGTGATTAGAALTALGGQPLDATLTALAGLATGADKLAYSTGADTFAQADFTSFARTLLDDANAGAVRTTLGVGTTDSPAFAGLTIADAGNILLGTGTGTKIGTATSQKLGFYNAAPVAQYSTVGTTTGFTAGSGSAVLADSTFTGDSGATAYTVGDVVRALKTLGLLAL